MQIQRIIPVISLLVALACGQPKQSENNTFGGNESVQSVFGNAPVANGNFTPGNFTNPSQQQQQIPQQQGFGNNPNMGMQQQMPQQQGFGNNPNMGMQQQMPQQQGFGNNPNMGMQQQMPQQQGFGNNPNMGMQQQMPQQQGFGNNPNMGMQQNPQQMQQGMVRPMLQQMQAQASAMGAQFQAWTFAGPMCVGLITVTRSQQGMECALEYTDVNYDYEYPLTFMGQNQGWYYFQVPNTQNQVYMDANGTQLYIGNSIVLQACTPEQCDQVIYQVASQRNSMQSGYGNYGDYNDYQGYY